MADWHNEALGGATLIQHANTPSFDKLARMGRNGLLKTVPDGFHPGSEVANSSILGYDQHKVYEGRGPLEAASIGVELEDGDFALRCNFVCLEGNLLKNHSCGRLETEEGDVLIKYLNEKLANDRVHFYTGVQYRHLLVIKGGDKRISFTPPHDIPLKPWQSHTPIPLPHKEAKGEDATSNGRMTPEETCDMLNDLILKSQELLKYHPLNIQRVEEGKDPANSIWPWGGGYKPQMVPLTERFASQIKKGSVITAVDLIRGIGHYAGLRVIDVLGATGLWDTNFRGKADAAIEAIEQGDDFVYVHVEACDEAGHDGDLQLKLGCIENLDRNVVGPILDYAQQKGNVAVALLPDHPTPIEYRTHTNESVPFAIWYPGILADSVQTFDEDAAKQGSYGTLEGDKFICTFMTVGRKSY